MKTQSLHNLIDKFNKPIQIIYNKNQPIFIELEKHIQIYDDDKVAEFVLEHYDELKSILKNCKAKVTELDNIIIDVRTSYERKELICYTKDHKEIMYVALAYDDLIIYNIEDISRYDDILLKVRA